ncbi:MAG: hypothetical protein WBX11_11155 [Thiobacillaceae bacterium]
MRPFILSAVLALACSTIIYAHAKMPTAGGSMGSPMPTNVHDPRTIVPLTEPERILVQERMRQMLTSVEQVTDGVARGDAKAVSEAASRSGTVMMQTLPMQIRKKFPPPFVQMAKTTHQLFDQIAHETKSVESPGPTLKHLAEAIQGCNACHAAYRFAPVK